MELYDFYTGKAFDAYQWLGGHVTEEGAVFRTFAPSAQGISLLIQGKELPMEKIADGNFYQLALPGIQAGEAYEYRVYTQKLAAFRTTATPSALAWSCGQTTGPSFGTWESTLFRPGMDGTAERFL